MCSYTTCADAAAAIADELGFDGILAPDLFHPCPLVQSTHRQAAYLVDRVWSSGTAEASVQFVANALVGLIAWWLQGDVRYSADELYSIFRRLAMQGVRRSIAA